MDYKQLEMSAGGHDFDNIVGIDHPIVFRRGEGP